MRGMGWFLVLEERMLLLPPGQDWNVGGNLVLIPCFLHKFVS